MGDAAGSGSQARILAGRAVIRYYIRINCHWLLVTTSVAVWAATPHAAYDVACSAAGWLAPPVAPVAFVPHEIPAHEAPVPVPEPATLAILAAGVAWLAARR